MSDVTNGIGDTDSVGTTATYSDVSTDQKKAMSVKVWNTHATQTLYVTVNTSATGVVHTTASAVPIPVGGNFVFWSQDKPIKTIGLSGSDASTTYSWGAY